MNLTKLTDRQRKNQNIHDFSSLVCLTGLLLEIRQTVP